VTGKVLGSIPPGEGMLVIVCGHGIIVGSWYLDGSLCD
jgi:hypothetical protein